MKVHLLMERIVLARITLLETELKLQTVSVHDRIFHKSVASVFYSIPTMPFICLLCLCVWIPLAMKKFISTTTGVTIYRYIL